MTTYLPRKGWRLKKIIVKLLFVLVFVDSGCAASDETHHQYESDVDSPNVSRAEQRLEALRGQGIVTYFDRYRHTNGELGYVRIKTQSEGGMAAKRAIMPSGALVPIPEARKEFALEHRHRWGALSLQAAGSVKNLPLTKIEDFVFWYDPDRIAPGNLEDTLEKAAESYEIRRREPYIVTASMSVGAVRTLAKDFRNDLFTIQRPASSIVAQSFSSNGYPNGEGIADYMRTQSKYNDSRSLYGDTSGIRIGVADSLGMNPSFDSQMYDGYPRMPDDHEAFEFADIMYTHPLSTRHCGNAFDCNANNDMGDTDGIGDTPDETNHNTSCRKFVTGESRCTTPENHITWVMSRIAASMGGQRHHAAETNFVVWNGPREPVNEDATVIPDIYDAFYAKKAMIINRSIGDGCPVDYDANDTLLSWYAVQKNMLTIKSSSNSDPGANGNYSPGVCNVVDKKNNERTDCSALDVLCVGATKNKGDIHDYTDDVIPVWSRWRNPFTSSGYGIPSDAERPDVVAEGSGGWLAQPYKRDSDGENSYSDPTTTAWIDDKSGTSFAAPAVTGLAALLVQECGGYPGMLGLRSMIRTGSYQQHFLEGQNHEAYPTPGFHPDAKAGAGVANALVSIFCGPGNGDGATADYGEDETRKGSKVPGWLYDEEPKSGVPTEEDENVVKSSLKLALSEHPKLKTLLSLGKFEKGRRLRATLSFPTCPADSLDEQYNIGTIRPAVDVDLVACGYNEVTDENDCEMISESFDDTNEGFDFISSADYSDFKVQMVYPTTTSTGEPLKTCGKFYDSEAKHTVSPVAWSAIWW